MGYPIGFPKGGQVGTLLQDARLAYERQLSTTVRSALYAKEDAQRQSLDSLGRCRLCGIPSAWITVDGKHFCYGHAAEYFRPFVQGEE